MATDDYEGRRVRLRPEAPIGPQVSRYLTDDQLRDGVEGFIVRAEDEGDRLTYDVKLENVPRPHRVEAVHCDLLTVDRRTKAKLSRRS